MSCLEVEAPKAGIGLEEESEESEEMNNVDNGESRGCDSYDQLIIRVMSSCGSAYGWRTADIQV